MQLVGAQSRFIRKPFLWQAIIQGAVSSVIGMALLMTLYYAIDKGLDIDLNFNFPSFLMVFGILVLFGVLMTWIFTLFALNKFLKMKLDDLY
jgi:cell division transport system permease protein